jgi:hypothetical protein
MKRIEIKLPLKLDINKRIIINKKIYEIITLEIPTSKSKTIDMVLELSQK